ncbi:hypothetical protein [Paenibacillus sp. 1P07SE]
MAGGASWAGVQGSSMLLVVGSKPPSAVVSTSALAAGALPPLELPPWRT